MRLGLISASAALLLLLPAAANADTLQFTSDHCTGSCGPQTSFASLSVTESAPNTLSFSITPNNGNTIINTGFPLSFGFDLAGNPSITYSGLTAGFSVVGSNPQSAGVFHMDGFGDAEYGVLWDLQGGGHGYSGTLSFSITGANLTMASLETLSGGAIGVLDIFSGTTGNTGLVDASPVPGPIVGAGLPGLIMACGGLVAFARRRRQRT